MRSTKPSAGLSESSIHNASLHDSLEIMIREGSVRLHANFCRFSRRISSGSQAPRRSRRRCRRESLPSHRPDGRGGCPRPDRRPRPLGPEPFGQQLQVSGAVAPADHVRFANERVDCSRAWQPTSKMRLRPDVDGVVLRIREGTAFKRDDPHDHARPFQIFRSSMACSSALPHHRTTSGVRNQCCRRGRSCSAAGRNP
jgi:hypothetical protein